MTNANAAAVLEEQRAYEDRVVRESERREYRAALSAASAQLSGETFIDDRGQQFTVGASVLAIQTIPYQSNDRSGVKWMACGTRGEIVTFAGTREYPTAAVQFNGRPSLHLFSARDLRAVLRVVVAEAPVAPISDAALSYGVFCVGCGRYETHCICETD